MSAEIPAALLDMCREHIDLTVGILRAASPEIVTIDDLANSLVNPNNLTETEHRQILAVTCAMLFHRMAFQ